MADPLIPNPLDERVSEQASLNESRDTTVLAPTDLAGGDDSIAAPIPDQFEGTTHKTPEDLAQEYSTANQNTFLENLGAGFKQTAAAKLGNFLLDEGLREGANVEIDEEGLTPAQINEAKYAEEARFTRQAFKSLFVSDTDPEYKKADHVEELTSGIPLDYHSDIMSYNNLPAAQRSRARVLAQMEEQRKLSIQNDGGITQFAGMMVDLDAPLTLVSGGAFAAAKTAGTTLRLAKKFGASEKAADTVSGLAVNLSAGLQAGVIVGAGEAAVAEGAGTDTVIYSTLMGAAMGGALYPLARTKGSELLADEFLGRVSRDDPALTAEQDVSQMGDPNGPTQSVVKPLSIEGDEAIESALSETSNPLSGTPKPEPRNWEDYLVRPSTEGTRAEITLATLRAKKLAKKQAESATQADLIAWEMAQPAGPNTVGASQIDNPDTRNTLKPFDNEDPLGEASETTQRITANSVRHNHDSGLNDRKADAEGTQWWKIGNSSWGSRLSGTGLQARMITSSSPTMNWLGNVVTESANGFNRGRDTASAYLENYHKRIQTQLTPVTTAMSSWARRHNQTIFGSGYGANKQATADFNRAVMLERNNRMMGNPRSEDPDIRLAADAYDNAARESYTINKGKDGEASVDGFQNVDENPHYTPYNWSGTKINDIVNSGKATLQHLTDALSNSYRRAGMSQGKDADLVASAVIRRAMLGESEMDTSVFSLLQADGQEFLREVLRDNGLDDTQANGLIKRLVGDSKERSQEGFTKSRNDVDMSASIETSDGSKLQIVDLLSNDLSGDWQRYTRRSSGAAALARQGITNRADRSEVITAIQSEQRALGEEITPRKELEAMFTAFDGGATQGWSSLNKGDVAAQGEAVGTLKRMVQLAWLNKLGLTQLGEMGAMMAQNGVANWARRGPMKWLDKELKAGNQALIDDMAYITGDIGQDHHFFSQHLNLDEVSDLDKQTLISKIQSKTASASYVQGFTSMFNQIRTFQQQTAALGMADKVMRTLKKSMDEGVELDDIDKARFWNDMGLDGETLNELEQLISSGVISFDETGQFVNRLHMDQWDNKLAQIFGASITRNINQVVQKSMAGETDTWMHTGWGSILTHLKTFPMQATQKQMVRHFRNNDPQAYAALGYGLATAMVASMVKDSVNPTAKEKSLSEHAERAFSYSNMTGFIPMYFDPLMSAMGLDDQRFNQFGQHAEIMPPVLSWTNDAFRIGGALSKAVTGEADYSDKQALRTLPFANTILIGDMLNSIGQKN